MLVYDRHLWEIVAIAQSVVSGVMRGRDLDSARAELGVNELVGDDGNLAADDWKHERLSNQPRVTLVVWVDRDGCIAKHRLRASCRDGHMRGNRVTSVITLDGILKVVELARLRLLVHFEVGERGLILRAPVDHAGAAID